MHNSTRGALIVGDLMIDFIVSPIQSEIVDPTSASYVDSYISVDFQGTGLSMARASREVGFTPTYLLHNWPENPAAWRFALEEFAAEIERLQIEPVRNVVASGDPGIAVVCYLGGPRRMMFGNAGTNDSPLSETSVRRAVGALERVAFVGVSGYMLFRRSTAHGVMEIIEAARKRNVLVVLDVVPHSVAHTISLEEFEFLTRNVDVVAVELNTLLQFRGLNRTAMSGSAVESTLKYFCEQFAGLVVNPSYREYWVLKRGRMLEQGAIDGMVNAIDHRGAMDGMVMALLDKYFV